MFSISVILSSEKPNVESELTDEERVLKCEIWHVIQNDKKELLNRTDLTALEKMQEHVRLHEVTIT